MSNAGGEDYDIVAPFPLYPIKPRKASPEEIAAALNYIDLAAKYELKGRIVEHFATMLSHAVYCAAEHHAFFEAIPGHWELDAAGNTTGKFISEKIPANDYFTRDEALYLLEAVESLRDSSKETQAIVRSIQTKLKDKWL